MKHLSRAIVTGLTIAGSIASHHLGHGGTGITLLVVAVIAAIAVIGGER